MSLQLEKGELELVRRLLAGEPGDVIVFGSRVKGTARPFSDLDLCLRRSSPISDAEMGRLRQLFEESDLPFKVDLVDWHRLAEDFRKLVETTGMSLS